MAETTTTANIFLERQRNQILETKLEYQKRKNEKLLEEVTLLKQKCLTIHKLVSQGRSNIENVFKEALSLIQDNYKRDQDPEVLVSLMMQNAMINKSVLKKSIELTQISLREEEMLNPKQPASSKSLRKNAQANALSNLDLNGPKIFESRNMQLPIELSQISSMDLRSSTTKFPNGPSRLGDSVPGKAYIDSLR